MALVVTGTRTTSGGILSSIRKHSLRINLKPAKKISIQFDPFGDNSRNLREFVYVMNRRLIRETNTDCRIRTEILSDNSEPLVEVILENNDRLVMKCSNLNSLDMIQLFNKYVSSLVPTEKKAQHSQVLKKSAK